MPHKQTEPEVRHAPLQRHGVVVVEGPDAAKFLQAQTMNDVAALDAGQWQWNGWLTPKGRVQALFALLRESAERFVLVVPDHPAAALADALGRFRFRSRLTLSADAGLVVAAGPAHPDARGDRAAGTLESGIACDMSGDGGPRTLWLLPGGTVDAGAGAASADADWFAADIAHGLPRLGPAQHSLWTPQMLSLQRLGAFSLRKGCYPGQEIVARTHYLGQARRGLRRIAGEGLAEGAVAGPDGVEAGTVICVTDDRRQGLAVLPVDAPGPFGVAGAPLAILPLLDGLARGI